MHPKLQQAIQAARLGQTNEAQFLLTQVLKDNPEEVQAWFLLSHLVDSEQKQLVYLRKAVALDPHHEKAAQRLAQLEEALSTETSTEALEMEAERMDDTLPSWMTEEAEEMNLESAVTAPTQLGQTETPDWLKEVSQDIDSASILEEQVPQTETTSAAKPPQSPVDRRKKQAAVLTGTIIVLIIAAAIVLIWLLFTIF